jgi:hypothetical protein
LLYDVIDIDADAEGIRLMLSRHNMRPSDVDVAVGDVNSAGTAMAGRKVNELLGEALGLWIRPAKKGAGSVNAGISTINVALSRRHLCVHPRASNTHKMMGHWQGKDDDLKHYFDALSYVAAPEFDTCYRGSQPRLELP